MMKRTKFNKKPKKTGPKREFTAQQLQDAQDLVGCFGARNKDLAEYFEVNESTIDYWIKNYEDFRRAVKKGRIQIGMQVSKALVAKAIGYKHPSEKIIQGRDITYDPETGKPISSSTSIIRVPTIKQYPPDAYAAHKYLSLVFRELWAENNDINHKHTIEGTITHKKVEELSFEDLNDEQKALLFSLNLKQLSNENRN